MKLMYINGEFTNGNAKEVIEVTDPATEEILDTVPRGTAGDVAAAVHSASEAFTQWRKLGARQFAGAAGGGGQVSGADQPCHSRRGSFITS